MEAYVDPQYFSPIEELDVALLRVTSLPKDVKPLTIALTGRSIRNEFYAYGYATVTDVQGIGARGVEIVDLVDNRRLIQLESTQPDHGMSGAPVLDEQRQVVIGMITKGKTLPEKIKACAISSPLLPHR